MPETPIPTPAPAPTPTLDFSYDNHSGEEHAIVGRYRVRAVVDTHPEDPFDCWDSHWPMQVYSGGNRYSSGMEDKVIGIEDSLDMFTDALLVHFQHHVAKILSVTVQGALSDYCADNNWPLDDDDSEIYPKHCTDPDALRLAFEGVIEHEIEGAGHLQTTSELYDLLGVASYRTQSRGYSQGDWAELLVVATPDKVTEFFSDSATPEDIEKSLEIQADLWGDWAWGNIYGCIVEENVGTEDDPEWEESADGSCWGFYGTDHEESGLASFARECLPKDAETSVPRTELEVVEAAAAKLGKVLTDA